MSPTADLSAMVAASAAALQGPLEPWGPRAGADKGDPQTAGLALFEGHGVQVGVWECSPGGWTIVDRVDTESMLLLSGRVLITPADGDPVELGAGDVFVLPKGWSGRWDVLERVRKFYVVSA
jgi:uncharacterized cupin superfamily protein